MPKIDTTYYIEKFVFSTNLNLKTVGLANTIF